MAPTAAPGPTAAMGTLPVHDPGFMQGIVYAQAAMRGYLTRKWILLLLEPFDEEHAAKCIQRVWQGHRGRRLASLRRAQTQADPIAQAVQARSQQACVRALERRRKLSNSSRQSNRPQRLSLSLPRRLSLNVDAQWVTGDETASIPTSPQCAGSPRPNRSSARSLYRNGSIKRRLSTGSAAVSNVVVVDSELLSPHHASFRLLPRVPSRSSAGVFSEVTSDAPPTDACTQSALTPRPDDDPEANPHALQSLAVLTQVNWDEAAERVQSEDQEAQQRAEIEAAEKASHQAAAKAAKDREEREQQEKEVALLEQQNQVLADMLEADREECVRDLLFEWNVESLDVTNEWRQMVAEARKTLETDLAALRAKTEAAAAPTPPAAAAPTSSLTSGDLLQLESLPATPAPTKQPPPPLGLLDVPEDAARPPSTGGELTLNILSPDDDPDPFDLGGSLGGTPLGSRSGSLLGSLNRLSKRVSFQDIPMVPSPSSTASSIRPFRPQRRTQANSSSGSGMGEDASFLEMLMENKGDKGHSDSKARNAAHAPEPPRASPNRAQGAQDSSFRSATHLTDPRVSPTRGAADAHARRMQNALNVLNEPSSPNGASDSSGSVRSYRENIALSPPRVRETHAPALSPAPAPPPAPATTTIAPQPAPSFSHHRPSRLEESPTSTLRVSSSNIERPRAPEPSASASQRMLLVAREDTLPLPWLQLVNRVASVEDGLGKETPVTLAAAPNTMSSTPPPTMASHSSHAKHMVAVGQADGHALPWLGLLCASETPRLGERDAAGRSMTTTQWMSRLGEHDGSPLEFLKLLSAASPPPSRPSSAVRPPSALRLSAKGNHQSERTPTQQLLSVASEEGLQLPFLAILPASEEGSRAPEGCRPKSPMSPAEQLVHVGHRDGLVLSFLAMLPPPGQELEAPADPTPGESPATVSAPPNAPPYPGSPTQQVLDVGRQDGVQLPFLAMMPGADASAAVPGAAGLPSPPLTATQWVLRVGAADGLALPFLAMLPADAAEGPAPTPAPTLAPAPTRAPAAPSAAPPADRAPPDADTPDGPPPPQAAPATDPSRPRTSPTQRLLRVGSAEGVALPFVALLPANDATAPEVEAPETPTAVLPEAEEREVRRELAEEPRAAEAAAPRAAESPTEAIAGQEDAGGSGQVQVTAHVLAAGYVQWGPDGGCVAKGGEEDVGGSGEVRVTAHVLAAGYVQWQPDGGWAAKAGQEDVGGLGQVRVTAHVLTAGYVQWRPDGGCAAKAGQENEGRLGQIRVTAYVLAAGYVQWQPGGGCAVEVPADGPLAAASIPAFPTIAEHILRMGYLQWNPDSPVQGVPSNDVKPNETEAETADLQALLGLRQLRQVASEGAPLLEQLADRPWTAASSERLLTSPAAPPAIPSDAGLGDRPLTGLWMLAVVGDVGVAQRASCLDDFLDTPWTITPAPLLLAHPEPLHTPLPCESRPPMKAPTDPAAPPEDPASPPLTPLPAETALPAAELSGPEVGEETALGEAGPDEVAVAEVEEGPGSGVAPEPGAEAVPKPEAEPEAEPPPEPEPAEEPGLGMLVRLGDGDSGPRAALLRQLLEAPVTGTSGALGLGPPLVSPRRQQQHEAAALACVLACSLDRSAAEPPGTPGIGLQALAFLGIQARGSADLYKVPWTIPAGPRLLGPPEVSDAGAPEAAEESPCDALAPVTAAPADNEPEPLALAEPLSLEVPPSRQTPRQPLLAREMQVAVQKRQRQDRAAAAIQALWRGHCGRRRAERQREAVRGAQQAAVRRRAAAERVQQGREAVLRAQRAKDREQELKEELRAQQQRLAEARAAKAAKAAKAAAKVPPRPKRAAAVAPGALGSLATGPKGGRTSQPAAPAKPRKVYPNEAAAATAIQALWRGHALRAWFRGAKVMLLMMRPKTVGAVDRKLTPTTLRRAAPLPPATPPPGHRQTPTQPTSLSRPLVEAAPQRPPTHGTAPALRPATRQADSPAALLELLPGRQGLTTAAGRSPTSRDSPTSAHGTQRPDYEPHTDSPRLPLPPLVDWSLERRLTRLRQLVAYDFQTLPEDAWTSKGPSPTATAASSPTKSPPSFHNGRAANQESAAGRAGHALSQTAPVPSSPPRRPSSLGKKYTPSRLDPLSYTVPAARPKSLGRQPLPRLKPEGSPKHADTRGVMPGGPSVSRIAVELYSTPTVGVGRSYT